MSENQIELIQGEKGMELPITKGNWVLLRDYGYSSVQSLVVAVGTCGTYVYQLIVTNSKIDYAIERMKINYERDEERKSEPVKLISLTFDVHVAPEQQERTVKALKLIVVNCPVIQSLNPSIELQEKVEFI